MLADGNEAWGGSGGGDHNTPWGGGNGAAGKGGALSTWRSTVTVVNSTFQKNRARNGAPGWGEKYPGFSGDAFGGAIHADGSLMLNRCQFLQNSAGPGSIQGVASGGAVFAQGNAVLISNCIFSSNSVTGGDGIRLAFTLFFSGQSGRGGAISTAATTSIAGSTFSGNVAWGGRGPGFPFEGSGYGGALASSRGLNLLNCTLVGNQAFGNTADAQGGGLYCGGAQLTHVTFALNSAIANTLTNPPKGGAIFAYGPVRLRNTILAYSGSGSNWAGAAVLDEGNNFSSDSSCFFTTPGSRSNVDPRLGVLGDYWGPTPTIPLLPGSPAIDAGEDAWCPAFDQRGFPRPHGGRCDAGAFEVPNAFLFTSITLAGDTEVRLCGWGVPTRNFFVQSTVDLSNWQGGGTGVVSSTGIFDIRLPKDSRTSASFYRTRVP